MNPARDFRRFVFCIVAASVAAVPIALASETWSWSDGLSFAVLMTVSSSISLFALRDILFRRATPDRGSVERRRGG